MCVLPSTLNWEILGAEICRLCLLDPKYSPIRIGTQLLVFVNQRQTGDPSPQWEQGLFPYHSPSDLYQSSRRQVLWLVLGGQSEEQTIPAPCMELPVSLRSKDKRTGTHLEGI